jgi:hypothetical protein
VERVDPSDPATVSRAIVVWSGWGETRWPARDDARLAERFGGDVAPLLISRIRPLEDDFYSSNADVTSPAPGQMGETAASEFRARHPELSEDAVQAFAWCYTWDYK